MVKIAIPFDDSVAKSYQSAGSETKKKMNLLINVWIKNLSSRNKTNTLFKTMDEASKEAKKNGLSEKILEDILNGK